MGSDSSRHRLLPLLAAGLTAALCASCCVTTGTPRADAGIRSAGDRDDMHFGLNDGLYPPWGDGVDAIVDATEELDELGMVWLRQPGRDVSWFEVQPTRDQWRWAKLDAVVDDNDHPLVLEVYGIAGTVYPFGGDFSKQHLRQMGKRGRGAVMDYMADNAVDMRDDNQRADAERYVKAYVERYEDQIRYWQIGNEGLGGPQRPLTSRYTYQWIKEVQPDAQVLSSAPAGGDDKQFRRALENYERLINEAGGGSFDIANFHYYGPIDGDFEGRLEERYDEFAAVLDNHGLHKPIWVTETATSSAIRSEISGASSEQLQAQHVVIRLVVFSAKGAEKVFWHNYKQEGRGSRYAGVNLVMEDGTAKPAYHTFKLLVEKIGYYETVETLSTDPYRLYRFTNPDGGVVLVGWAEDELEVDLSEHLDGRKVLISPILEESGLTESQMEYGLAKRVRLSPSPIFVEKK